MMHNAAGQSDGVGTYSEPCTGVLGAKDAKAQQVLMHNAAGQDDGVGIYSEPCTGVLGAKDASLS